MIDRITLFIFILTLVASCKKTNETSAFKIENGIIGVMATNGTKFGVDPSNDKAFLFKRSKINQSLSNFTALNKEQSLLYLIKTDSIGFKYIDEIDTKTGNIIGSYQISVFIANMVLDESNNRLLCISAFGISSCFVYAFDLQTKLLTNIGSYSGSNLFIAPGKSFVRGGFLYIASFADLFAIDLNNKTIKTVTNLGSTTDVEYDVIRDCVYYAINLGSSIQIGKYEFATARKSVLLDVQEAQTPVQASLCFKYKTNELVYYTNALKKVTVSLSDLSVKIVDAKLSFTGCQSLYNNVEVSLSNVQY